MTVRVWLKPNELGDAGSVIEFGEASGYEATDDGTLLLFQGGADDEDVQVGLVNVGRWDACVVVEEAAENGG